ncbi:MAG: cyclopropane-fatty-acyl-phospholipid synthase family protein [Wenzhouxiangellaceae bacterium]
MSESAIRQASHATYGLWHRLLRTAVDKHLEGLEHGLLTIEDRLGTRSYGNPNSQLRVHVTVEHPDFYRLIAFEGGIGAGEAYMRQYWRADDLTSFIRILARNRQVLSRVDGGAARISAWLMRGWHAFNRNSLSGSRRNIAAHYDLSNDFFKLFLDDSLMYSSAWYRDANDTLEQAQTAKLDRICQQLGLQPGMRVIEIGTGWGGFALHAARHYGCHVSTTTISQAQYDEAAARIREAGLEDQIQLLFEDYRNLDGQYDRLVSIEMVEAVGDHYVDDYFGRVAGLLKADGMALIQAITIEDYRYREALRRVDFIKRYIFPGSFIPSLSRLTQAAAKTDLMLNNVHDLGASYALTLAEWRRRFNSRLEAVKALGFDSRFIRMWEFYLCYCEGGFAERAISDVQLLFSKPRAPNPLLTAMISRGESKSPVESVAEKSPVSVGQQR